jgi:hypothetical protein
MEALDAHLQEKAHFPFEVAIDVHEDAEHEIAHQGQHGKAHVYQRAAAYADEHDGFVDDIYVMVDVEAVGFALKVAHAGEGTVQRVPEPVD